MQDEGFVIDGRLGATPWRLEWGPSQRPYIQGHELRLRAEMGLASDLQLVLMNRELQETMEKAVFDQYVEGVQTRIDNQTPARDALAGDVPQAVRQRDGRAARALRRRWRASSAGSCSGSRVR